MRSDQFIRCHQPDWQSALDLRKSFSTIIKKLLNDAWSYQMQKLSMNLCGTKWNQQLNRLALAQTSFSNRVNSSRLFLYQPQFISSRYCCFSCFIAFDTCYHLSSEPFVSANVMQFLCFLKDVLHFFFLAEKNHFLQFVFLIIMNPRESRLKWMLDFTTRFHLTSGSDLCVIYSNENGDWEVASSLNCGIINRCKWLCASGFQLITFLFSKTRSAKCDK